MFDMPELYKGAVGQNPGPLACTAGTVLAEPSPLSLKGSGYVCSRCSGSEEPQLVDILVINSQKNESDFLKQDVLL